jgi:hypothetical protein
MNRGVDGSGSPTVSHVAAFLRCALHYKMIGVKDAVAWADHQIETENNPPFWAFDL